MLLAVCLAAAAALTARADSAISKEYRVKAVYLFNFVQFVEWPANALPPQGEPIRIGILGDDPFGAFLDKVVENESVQNHRLVVKRDKRLENLRDCHVLFICKSEAASTKAILALLRNDCVLTVSEVDGFAADGGIINFILVEGKIRFEINVSVAQNKRLKLSSQLLKLGKIVGPQE